LKVQIFNLKIFLLLSMHLLITLFL